MRMDLTVDEMIQEISVMKLNLSMSPTELEGLNRALNLTLDTQDINVVRSVHSILTVLQSSLNATNTSMYTRVLEADYALKREGLFTPQMMYQMKEDFEAVSLLHTKFKKETNRLVEEGQIATCRNAKLRLENEDLLAEIECLKGKLAS